MKPLPEGVKYFPALFDDLAQKKLLEVIREITEQAPLFVPAMPRSGKPLSVRMTNCGTHGWVTDKDKGYRYQSHHPVTGAPWPQIPQILLDVWNEYADFVLPPQACLINYYDAKAKMGLHQDKDEEFLDAPVLSVSLGDDCLFRIGGTERKDKTCSLKLHSGDVIILDGASRLAFHGVDRIYPDTSYLLKKQGRINLTLRRVTK